MAEERNQERSQGSRRPPADTSPQAPAAPEKISASRTMLPIAASNFRVDHAGLTTNVYHALILPGTPFERVLEPDYWSNVTDKFMVGSPAAPALRSRILVDAMDGGFSAQLIVLGVQREPGKMPTAVYVSKEWFACHDRFDDRFDPATHEATYRGERMKWCVVRLADNRVVSEGHDSQAAARLRLRTPA